MENIKIIETKGECENSIPPFERIYFYAFISKILPTVSSYRQYFPFSEINGE